MNAGSQTSSIWCDLLRRNKVTAIPTPSTNGNQLRGANGDDQMTSATPVSISRDDVGISSKGKLFMIALALQFGLQPLLQKACVDRDRVDKISLVLMTEVTKIAICSLIILSHRRNTSRYVMCVVDTLTDAQRNGGDRTRILLWYAFHASIGASVCFGREVLGTELYQIR